MAINAGLSLVKDGLQDMEGPLGPLGAGINVVSKGMRAFADGVASIPVVGDALGPALKLVTAYQTGDWTTVDAARQACPVDDSALDRAYVDSLTWAEATATG